MELEFQDKKLEKHCQDEKELHRKYGNVQAKLIIKRLNQLQAAESLYDIFKLPQTRLHSLKGDRQRQLAVDVQYPKRLILTPLNGDIKEYKTITKIKIIEIIDYH